MTRLSPKRTPARTPAPARAWLAAACTAALLCACASKPPAPSWQPDAKSSMDGFLDAWLHGDTLAADAEFARARRATAATGRFDLVAQAELVRCAARVAALDYDCPGYAALAGDATAAQRAYAAYLDGRWQGLDASLLPEQHRSVVASGSLAGVADPLARLVAAGALLKAGRIAPGDIAAAVDTASAQGWRRPLLAWLGVQEQRAQAAGDVAAAEQIRRRRALVGE
jgi:hypothetical protein